MNQKIEWYREVLELEPGSRVFFPLAKLLAAENLTGEAITALRQGLLRHPDHVEARLLLVDLLSLEGAGAELGKEIAVIGELLSGYPGFWQAWSQELAAHPDMQDAALAIRFLGASLQGKPITWAEVIRRGLAVSLNGAAGPTPGPDRPSVGVSVAQSGGNVLPLLSPPSSGLVPPSPRITPVKAAAPEEPDEEESEEAFSLRTRSMAEVLAEQGDLTGALDIYQELIQVAPEEEKLSLQARAEDLSRRMTAGTTQQGQQEEAGETSDKENSRLIGILEALAKRLEARAR
ncbi:MAG: tetratricopeptide repeat-containing protein [Deltaproteobacteria bacterium]|jgi:tetratricopeptide (TPR) repeat protein|nr:tetratricopeptide repeat-containing protein [Deltaproteobacteria bacterium]